MHYTPSDAQKEQINGRKNVDLIAKSTFFFLFISLNRHFFITLRHFLRTCVYAKVIDIRKKGK